jgi:dihydrofolate reductase
MRKLIEVTHVTLGGEIGSPQTWGRPYLNEEHMQYATEVLSAADALLLGRLTYEGLSAGYTTVARNAFVDRMNSIPKWLASTTLTDATWNATVIDGDVAAFVADLKQQPGKDIVKYGNGPLDATLMEYSLIDEFHLLLTPVAVGRGQRLFEAIAGSPRLRLADIKRFSTGVLVLTYVPDGAGGATAVAVSRYPWNPLYGPPVFSMSSRELSWKFPHFSRAGAPFQSGPFFSLFIPMKRRANSKSEIALHSLEPRPALWVVVALSLAVIGGWRRRVPAEVRDQRQQLFGCGAAEHA